MSNRFSYFNTASRIFWILFGLILLFCLFRFDKLFFKQEGLVERIVPKKQKNLIPDTIPVPKSDSISKRKERDDLKTFVWEWNTPSTGRWKLKNRNYRLSFSLTLESIKAAEEYRSKDRSLNSLYDFHKILYLHDVEIIEPMISQYKEIAKNNHLDYMETMEMVISSVQFIPYTWVLSDNPSCGEYSRQRKKIPPYNCRVNPDPCGCCDGIDFGVYSPVEFATRKTGDCDTRSLFAFTILKKMGYDVAVMSNRGHSVIGVNLPGFHGDNKRGDSGNARDYLLWELTGYGFTLGEDFPGIGYGWIISIK